MRSVKVPSRLLIRPKGREYCNFDDEMNSHLFRNIRPALGSTVYHPVRSKLLEQSLDRAFIEEVELSKSRRNAGASEANRVPSSGSERVVNGRSKHPGGSCDDDLWCICHER